MQRGLSSQGAACKGVEPTVRPNCCAAMRPSFPMITSELPIIRELTSSVNTMPSGRSNGVECGGSGRSAQTTLPTIVGLRLLRYDVSVTEPSSDAI